jgi:hypothetical protein
LIVEPLQHLKLKDTFSSSTVIVIDALDECKGEETISTILSMISQFVTCLPVKIFITSRPEVGIRHAFSADADLYLHAETRPFILHEIERSVVKNDLTQFLRQGLKRVEAMYPTLKGRCWYTEADIGVLAVKSEGDRISQLHNLLRRDVVVKPPKSSPYWHLDQLYAQVLSQAFPKSSAVANVARFRAVVGTIVLLRSRLTAVDLALFLGTDVLTVTITLQNLHSVLVVPEQRDVIQIMHASFPDFLTRQPRCDNVNLSDLHVDPPLHHRLLLIRCFEHLTYLRRDICRLGNPSKLNSQHADLDERARKYISPALQYACRHWAEHLSKAVISESIIESLSIFCFELSLYWLEALSIMGCLELAISFLELAKEALQVSFAIPLPILTPPNPINIESERLPCLSAGYAQ